ncbi:MAG: hypothetical protein R2754_14195 [Microthrixaceae bacterium]
MAKRSKSNRRRNKRKKPVDLWRPVPLLPDPEPIAVNGDPTTLIRSLGNPPLPGQNRVAEHYLVAVAERASGVAEALAAASGLRAEPDGQE